MINIYIQTNSLLRVAKDAFSEGGFSLKNTAN